MRIVEEVCRMFLNILIFKSDASGGWDELGDWD